MTSDAGRAIEAILMVAQEPIDPHLLAQLLEVSPAIIEQECEALAASYEQEGRGFVLVRVAGGYRFQSHGDLAAYVERFVLEGQSARLSAAALETLAIVAYKQPLSRAQVAAIRGVNVDGVMRTLQQRGYVEEIGKDPGPGQATLFGTSKEFLERLGLDRIGDLPPLAELFPSAEVMEALEQGLLVRPVTEATDGTPIGEAAAPNEVSPAIEPAAPAPDRPSGEEPPEAASTESDATAEPSGATVLQPVSAAGPDQDGLLDDDPFEEPDRPEPELPSWARPEDPSAPADPS